MSSFLRVDNSSISLYPAEVTETWHECSIDSKCNFLVKQQEKSKVEKRESIIAVTDYFAVWKKIPFPFLMFLTDSPLHRIAKNCCSSSEENLNSLDAFSNKSAMKRTGFVIVRYLISGIIFSWHSYLDAAGQEKMSSFLRVDNSSISLYPAEVTETWPECSIDFKCNFLVKQQEKSKVEKRESIIAVTDYFAVWKKIPFPSYRSCKNAYSSGTKESGTIQLLLPTLPLISTFCDMTTKGGGWTIIQRRVNNDFDFHRNWNDYKTGHVVRGENNMGPTAMLTRFGYVLSGPVNVPIHGGNTYSYHTSTHVMKVLHEPCKDEDLKHDLKMFWDYETLGIKENEPSVYDEFLNNVEFLNDRYEVSLPFKEDHKIIPDNYSVSEKRLFSLLNKLKNHPEVLNEYDKIISDQLKNGIIERVDPTVNFDTEALESYKELKLCFKRGGFNLRKWESNCCELADEIAKIESNNFEANNVLKERKIEEEDESFSKSSFKNEDIENNAKILGLAWDKTSDRIRFDFSKIFSNDCQFVTKREILSSTAKIYDPLGLLSPIVVPLKLLFQELCKKKVNWDTKLSEEISTEWRTIVSDIQSSPPVFVNRSVTDVNKDEIDHVELHGFSDASSIAFGAAVYIRVVKKSGKISVDLVAAKTRLVPLKSDTIPRLELMAALVLSRLIKSVKEALKPVIEVDKIFCWVDSQIVLWWIFSREKEYKPFVQNRVLEIRKHVPPSCWNFCPTDLNPADLASRGCKMSQISGSEIWWFGPTFLAKSENYWPAVLNFETKTKIPEDVSFELNRETKSNPRKDFSDVFVGVSTASNYALENVIKAEDFSDENRLFRVSAYVFRFVENLKRRLLKEDIETNDLTVEEVENARISWLRVIQSHLSSERNFDKNLVYLRVYEDENGRRLIDAPNVETYAEYDSSKTKLTHRQSHLKSLLKHFWNRWSSEYLLTLREFHKNKGKTGARIVAVGDVVVILNDKVKRQQWKLGKILKVYPGKDNIVRAADVKTTDSAGRSIILKRSITHLYPLEVREDSEKDYGIAAAAEPAVSDVFDVPIRFIADEEAEELIN
eukprot:gene3197-1511_t